MITKEELQEIYNKLPRLECQKKCQESCGPIEVDQIEKEQIIGWLKKQGLEFKEFASISQTEVILALLKDDYKSSCLTCPYLTKEGMCSIYDVRPLICRLWGIVEGMPCNFGCRPERYLTNKEAFELLNKVFK